MGSLVSQKGLSSSARRCEGHDCALGTTVYSDGAGADGKSTGGRRGAIRFTRHRPSLLQSGLGSLGSLHRGGPHAYARWSRLARSSAAPGTLATTSITSRNCGRSMPGATPHRSGQALPDLADQQRADMSTGLPRSDSFREGE